MMGVACAGYRDVCRCSRCSCIILHLVRGLPGACWGLRVLVVRVVGVCRSGLLFSEPLHHPAPGWAGGWVGIAWGGTHAWL